MRPQPKYQSLRQAVDEDDFDKFAGSPLPFFAYHAPPQSFREGSFGYKHHLCRKGERQDRAWLEDSACSNLTNKNMFSESPQTGILQLPSNPVLMLSNLHHQEILP